jgi:hypothetical protein
MNEVHAGSELVRYNLYDQAGRPIGTIAAPAEQPRFGSSAPTVYLRRE